MADFFGVSLRTVNSWKKKQPEFLHAIKGGKARADAEVASKLYDRATGFESVSACLLLLALGLVSWLRWVPFGSRDTGAWCVVLALLVIYRHRRNIELWISARRDATSGDGSSSTA
ncbi:hypothetical protein [Pedococcus soli]